MSRWAHDPERGLAGERTDLASRRPERVRVLHEQLMAYFQRMDAEVLHGYGKAKEEN